MGSTQIYIRPLTSGELSEHGTRYYRKEGTTNHCVESLSVGFGVNRINILIIYGYVNQDGQTNRPDLNIFRVKQGSEREVSEYIEMTVSRGFYRQGFFWLCTFPRIQRQLLSVKMAILKGKFQDFNIPSDKTNTRF